jgi:hypothetical protein
MVVLRGESRLLPGLLRPKGLMPFGLSFFIEYKIFILSNMNYCFLRGCVRILDDNEELRIEQKNLFGTQSYSIRGDSLKYNRKSLFKFDEFFVDLKDLDPRPQRYREIPVMWLLGMIVFLISFIALTLHIVLQKNVEVIGLDILLVILTIIFFKKVYDKSINIWLFGGNGNNLPIWANKPSIEEAAQFTNALSEKIRHCRSNRYNPEKNFLDFLKNEGLIDEWNYEKAAKFIEDK